MKSICFYFQVHQPFRLRTYRFFDIGENHSYYDEYLNKTIVRRVAEKCYLPANKLMLDLIKEYGSAFKISYSISGIALEQFTRYAPEVIVSFKKLADTGCVEFLAETYSHSLSSLKNEDEFSRQITQHANTIESLFGKRPTTFRNTELIYSDQIGNIVQGLGFNTMLTEGAKQILGWKSPNYLYCSARNPKLKLLLKNFQLSDDIAFRFSQHSWKEWPLTAEKFTRWLSKAEPAQEVINLFMNYETFGEHHWEETGIFSFLKALPKQILGSGKFIFSTPSDLFKTLQPISAITVSDPISWADEERDITAWLGNDLQNEAFDSLYSVADQMSTCSDPDLLRDWNYLQTSNHFYYMCTKWFSDGGAVHNYFNPYETPYEAFINYMNVISDFLIRVDDIMGKVNTKIDPIGIVLTKEKSKSAKSKPSVVSEAKVNKSKPIAKTVNKNSKGKPEIKYPKKTNLTGHLLQSLPATGIRAIAKAIGTPAFATALWNDKSVNVKALEQALGKKSQIEFRNILANEIAPSKSAFEKAHKLLLREIQKLETQ
ncbi:MAG: glycoside hydrolase family 57 protein [Bacteroidota bacterium]